MLKHYKGLKVLSLDAMNTVICLKESPGSVYSRFSKNYFNAYIEPSILDLNFMQSFRLMEKEYPCYAFNDGKAEFWWNQVLKKSFPKDTLGEQELNKLAKYLFKYYSTQEPWKLVENNLLQTLSSIKQMGITIVITSNFDYRLRKILEEFNLLTLIDHFILSGELGVEKPNPEMFQKVFDFCSTKIDSPQQILHIGDSLERDFFAATRFGAKALLYGRKRDLMIEEVHRIDSLSNLI